MSTLKLYLDLVPWWAIILAAFGYTMIIILLPSRIRIQCALAVMVVWLMFNKLVDLGFVQALSKATAFSVYYGVGLAAVLQPGPKRRLNPLVFIYPVMAVIAFLYVMTVTDRDVALVIRFQWLVLVVSAILLMRTVTDHVGLMRVLTGLMIGSAIGLLVLLSALVLNPAATYARGLGRIFPYQANPNQIGLMFCLSVFVFGYFALRASNITTRSLMIGFGAISFGLGLLTGSRSVVVVMAIPLLPLLTAATRRPVLTVLAIGIAYGVLSWVLGMAEERQLQRLLSPTSERYELIGHYIEVIKDRPIFGLANTSGQSSGGHVGLTHPHNAYIEMLYLGGLTLAVPMGLLVCVSLGGAFYTWRHRHKLPTDPVLINCLAALMFALYFHGFVNGTIYYPTYTWSFVHVFMSLLFMTLGIETFRYVKATKVV